MHLKQQHSYDAATPFLTEKNHLPSSPPSYSANPAQRSLADVEAQGVHYTPTPKRSRSRCTTIVLCVLLLTALCALGTWMIWDGNWIGSMKQRIGELQNEVMDMQAAVRGMKEAAKGLSQYLEELRSAMNSGEEIATGMEMGMGMNMGAQQEMGEGMSMEGWEM